MFALATLVQPEPREITAPIPTSRPPPRLAALFLDMMAAERGAAHNTLAAYARDLEDYLAHLDEIGANPFEVNPAAVRSYLARLDARGLKQSSTARRLSAVRQFHK